TWANYPVAVAWMMQHVWDNFDYTQDVTFLREKGYPLLKAAASVQHGFIAPNLLFERLNPSVEPYYKGLRVPTTLQEWPALPKGVPRRASVNSFGFGGTNAPLVFNRYNG
ncbi:MAG: hypothetical protein M1823_007796, partial [Watsoniomyces obsoletus]